MANCVQCGRKLPPFTFSKICQWCKQHEAAQRGDLGDEEKQIVMPAPWVRSESTISVTKFIMGANVMVFIAMVIAMVLAGTPSLEFPGEIRASFGGNYGPYTLSGDWWRLVTYMFVHGDILHIAMNMWCLWNMGPICESLYGRWTYAAIYGITGISGGLASLAWNPGVLSVGASGAVFGLAGALIASFYLGEFSLSGLSIKSTLSSLVFFAGFNLFFGSVFPGIDNACHIGGLVSGLILGALIARVAPDHNNHFRRVSVLVFMVLVLLSSAVAVQRWRGDQLRLGSSPLRRQRNLNAMISDLQRKVQQQPQDPSLHYNLARAYLVNRQYPEAATELKRVLELQPQNTSARLQLGDLYLRRDLPKDAQQEFSKLTAEDPNNYQAHIGLAMAFADQQNHEAAVDEYKTALRIDPNLNGIYYRIGMSQAELKRYDDAIASFLKERENGDDPDLESALADAYQAKGMTQQAQEARNKAAQLKNE